MILITPPIASLPYKLDEAPLIISICLMFPVVNLFISNVPASLPITGKPSISTSVYWESKPCNWIPSPPPKSVTVIKPICSFKISVSLTALLFRISVSEIIWAGIGNEERIL